MLKLPWRRKQEEMEKAGGKRSVVEVRHYKRKPERGEILAERAEPCHVSSKMPHPLSWCGCLSERKAVVLWPVQLSDMQTILRLLFHGIPAFFCENAYEIVRFC